MIWESQRWKKELLSNANALERLSQVIIRSERQSFEIERIVFLSAFIIRKLWEARKLSSAWESRCLQCSVFRRKGRAPDLMGWHHLDRFYALDEPRLEALSALEICNRLIHSFIFMEHEHVDGTLAGFLFASDKSKGRGLWLLECVDFRKMLADVGTGYPSSAHMVRHGEDGEWAVWSGDGDPPREWHDKADLMRKQYIKGMLSKKRASDF